jgi:ABC-type Fe3+-siderophore transport system permease subunit
MEVISQQEVGWFMNVMMDLAMKVGGVLAFVGALMGGWLRYPTCEPSGGCHTILGEVARGPLGQPDTVQLVGVGAAVGAVIGALIGLFIAWLWPHTKKDLEIG